MKDTISEVLNLHVKETNDKNSNIQNKEYIINDQLLLETMLMMIRGETIKYSAYKKKSRLGKKNS